MVADCPRVGAGTREPRPLEIPLVGLDILWLATRVGGELRGKDTIVQPHAHISATHLIAGVLATIAVFGTLHLLALTADNRLSRAYISLGF